MILVRGAAECRQSLLQIAGHEMRIVVTGNCQHSGLAQCLGAMLPKATVRTQALETLRADLAGFERTAAENDVILIQRDQISEDLHERFDEKIIKYPRVFFDAFHPDLTYLHNGNQLVSTPLYHYNSKITIQSYLNGFSVSDTLKLFIGSVYADLGYLSRWEAASEALLREGQAIGFPLHQLLSEWRRSGCFMFTLNHPKIAVVAGIARVIVDRLGLNPVTLYPENYLVDPLSLSAIWPIYPEIGKVYGLKGDYGFKLFAQQSVIGLKEFVEQSFAAYSALPLDGFPRELAADQNFRLAAERQLTGRVLPPTLVHTGETPPASSRADDSTPPRTHPYSDLPPHHFWRRSVSSVPFTEVDPVVGTPVQIQPHDRVASAGSCFAQNISRALKASGFNYYVTENAPTDLPREEATERNYGVFSARYGNIYTARQLLQLIDRAYGFFTPSERVWWRPDGRAVDPFRPTIEPAGFSGVDELTDSVTRHLAAVRTLFERLDYFIFTLGLTEAWRSTIDGCVFPLAPGVSGGVWDRERHEFVNLSYEDVVDDFTRFYHRLTAVNAGAKVVLTVSPVPLAATYESAHVMVSNSHSKAVLRAAAGRLSASLPNVFYFPSYEIVTAPSSAAGYYHDDRREVRKDGVEHVMRVFLHHYTTAPHPPVITNNSRHVDQSGFEVVCDEGLLDSYHRPGEYSATPAPAGRDR